MAKKSSKYFKTEDFSHKIQKLCSYLFKLLNSHRKNICVVMQSGIVMLHIMTNNSISTGLILLAPTVVPQSSDCLQQKLILV